jgi:hypothetical protein
MGPRSRLCRAGPDHHYREDETARRDQAADLECGRKAGGESLIDQRARRPHPPELRPGHVPGDRAQDGKNTKRGDRSAMEVWALERG